MVNSKGPLILLPKHYEPLRCVVTANVTKLSFTGRLELSVYFHSLTTQLKSTPSVDLNWYVNDTPTSSRNLQAVLPLTILGDLGEHAEVAEGRLQEADLQGHSQVHSH